MGRSFQVSSQQIGLVATFTQVGYALGILLFVPLADLFDRRKLIVALTLTAFGALAAAAAALPLIWLLAASFLIGLTTVAPQVINGARLREAGSGGMASLGIGAGRIGAANEAGVAGQIGGNARR